MDKMQKESSLAILIKTHRLFWSYSQKTLAQLCGVTCKTIRNIEQGKLVPPPEVVVNLAKYLHLEFRQIILAAVLSELELPDASDLKLVSYAELLKPERHTADARLDYPDNHNPETVVSRG